MTLTLVSVTAIILMISLGAMIRRLLAPDRATFVTPDWLARFSVARYRPMERLLSDPDFRFAGKVADAPRLRRFRHTRAKIFRQYLCAIALDFNRLHRTARLMIVNSATDQSQLATQLMIQRFIFSAALLRLHFRILLFEAGVRGTDLKIGTLLDAIEAKRSQLSELLMLPASAAARA